MKTPNPVTKWKEVKNGLTLHFSPLEKSEAHEIVAWRYEPPYDIYNLKDSDETIQYMLDRQYQYYGIQNEQGDLVGFCSFGLDAQVPGGNYEQPALDIGMGIRPDFTGEGHGSNFSAAVLEFARREFNPAAFRVTIAAFNQRAQRVWEKNGFCPTENFNHKGSYRDFIVMVKDAK